MLFHLETSNKGYNYLEKICSYRKLNATIHPSIFFTSFFRTGSQEAGVHLQQSMDMQPGQFASPSQGNTGQNHTHPFTPMVNSERPINLTVMFLDCGRKPKYREITSKKKQNYSTEPMYFFYLFS
ncbi:hypothetical protein CHARACLAT_008402 [Characodon lateralis]|uniref:Uncharacterized protein n=1 Tax=Characodon lateralis TaxID=208331 RepID=A0ABU7EHD9_9TELE|nr:hypothetical protein [Characodon lateralis]